MPSSAAKRKHKIMRGHRSGIISRFTGLQRVVVRRTRLFFFNDAATTEIYTLSLHDALPIYRGDVAGCRLLCRRGGADQPQAQAQGQRDRSEEHTSELQSRENLVCRLLLEKKKKITNTMNSIKKKKQKQNII